MLKNIILKVAALLIIVMVMDFIIGRTLRHFYFTETSGVHFQTTYCMEKTNAKILVFGASRANHHYVPAIFEDSFKMTFNNTGRDGVGIFYQNALLRSVLQRYKPQVIILDWSGMFNKDQYSYDMIAALLPYYRTHPEFRDIVLLKSKFEKLKLLSQCYPFNSEILTTVAGNLKDSKKRKTNDKGYIPLLQEWHGRIDSVKNVTVYEADPVKIQLFTEFLRLAKRSGAYVFVIFSPMYRTIHYSQEVDICRKICAEEKIPLYNYLQDAYFLSNRQLFQDIGHLNNKGAELFSRLVCTRIKADMTKNTDGNIP